MPQRTWTYICILFFSVLFALSPSVVYAQLDEAEEDTTVKVKKKDLAGHQLTVGVDYFHPILNQLMKDRFSNEIAVNYYMRNEYYLAAEGGWGGSNVSYPDLSYKTTNQFFRFGFNKSILVRNKPDDWDMMFIGISAGAANVKRSAAAYTVTDNVWGTVSETDVEKRFQAYWAEINSGVRVEVANNLFLGWTVRGKFMMNGKSFKQIAPLYIGGFGKGDKNSSFDISMYVCYAMRWDRKKHAPAADTTQPAIQLPTPVKTTDSNNNTKPRMKGENK